MAADHFYSYMQVITLGNGIVLNTLVKSPVYETKYGDALYLDSVIIYNEEKEELVIFAVNKDLEENLEITCDLRQFANYRIVEHSVLYHDDLKAVNTQEHPDTVRPQKNGRSCVENGILIAWLKCKSWNVILLDM